MVNVLLVLLVPLLLALFASRVARAHADEDYTPPLVPLCLLAYVVRAVMFYVGNLVQFFSHEAGGDSKLYAYYAEVIVAIWRRGGLHYVDKEEFFELGATSLPPNFHAFIALLNGGDVAREGGAALSALFCGVTALNLFSLCLELGASQKRALWMAAITLFLPSLVLYSSDIYKDPMVWMLTLGMIGSTLRLMRSINARDIVIALLCCVCLWYIRFYLLFLTAAPLAIGVLGLNSKNPGRTLLVVLLGIGLAIPIAAYTRVLGDFTDRATDTFDMSTSLAVRAGTAKATGSGVVFDDGGNPLGALPQKLLYTLFAPFVWQAGSLGFNLGKIDALVMTYIFWRAIKGARQLYKTDPSSLLVLLSFTIPTAFAYAITLNNVGTTLRQRIPVLLGLMMLASLSWNEQEQENEDEEDEDEEPEDDETIAQQECDGAIEPG